MKKLLIYILLAINTNVNAVNYGFNIDVDEVKVSYYHPVSGQCEGNPLITASGDKINLKKLKSGNLRWLAVSRDLRKKYKMGDTIYVESDNQNIRGYWIVKDVMAKRWRKKVDFLVHPKNHRGIITNSKVKIKRVKVRNHRIGRA